MIRSLPTEVDRGHFLRRRLLLAALAAGSLAREGFAAAESKPIRSLAIYNLFDACSAPASFQSGLLEALEAIGYVAGRNLTVIERCAEMDEAQALAAAAALKGAHAAYTFGARAVRTLRRGGAAMPILAIVNDAVEEGLTRDYRRPEGDATGLCNRHPDMPVKLIEHFRAALPGVRRMAIVAEGAAGTPLRPWMQAFERAARSAGFDVTNRVVPLGQFDRTYSELKKTGIGAAFVWTEKWAENEAIFRLAARRGIAIVSLNPMMAELGGFMGYNVWIRNGEDRLAAMMDKVFRGVRVADIPWELPDQPLLSLNLSVARSLGIKVPQALLLNATKVIGE